MSTEFDEDEEFADDADWIEDTPEWDAICTWRHDGSCTLGDSGILVRFVDPDDPGHRLYSHQECLVREYGPDQAARLVAAARRD